MQTPHSNIRVAIYGGTGFVGTHIAQKLCEAGLTVSCISRTGDMPLHLSKNDSPWAKHAHWIKGDVSFPDSHLLQESDIVVTTVGSPPLPTFSKQAYDNQYLANGLGNIRLIEACKKHEVKHVIIISAFIPPFLRNTKFAYYQGKQDLIDKAKDLFKKGPTQLSILYPSMIYGTRHGKSGRSIPLNFMDYPSKLLKSLPFQTISGAAPVSVKSVANATLDLIVSTTPKNDYIHDLENIKILDY